MPNTVSAIASGGSEEGVTGKEKPPAGWPAKALVGVEGSSSWLLQVAQRISCHRVLVQAALKHLWSAQTACQQPPPPLAQSHRAIVGSRDNAVTGDSCRTAYPVLMPVGL